MVESVALEGSSIFLPPGTMADLPGLRIVYLHHLRRLEIYTLLINSITAFNLASFLDHLAISSLSHLGVKYSTGMQYDSVNVGPIFPAFARLCQGQQDAVSIKNVYIKPGDVAFLDILGWTEPQGNVTERWVQGSSNPVERLKIVDMWARTMKRPRFQLGVPYNPSSSALQAMILALGTLPLSDVTSLTVQHCYDQLWWSNSHLFFPHLEELTVVHESVETFLHAFAITRLCPPHGNDSTTNSFLNEPSSQQLHVSSTHDKLIFPQLRCLYIYTGKYWYEMELYMDSFVNTLITRRELGCALERLDFIDYNSVKGASMRRLREVVPIVFHGERLGDEEGVVQEWLEDEHDNIVHGRELRSG